jgi:hypothetical protein
MPCLRLKNICLLKNGVYKEQVNTREVLIRRIRNTAAKKERHEAIRRATSALCGRSKKCLKVNDGIF